MARYIDANILAKTYMLKGKDKLRLATVINELELAPTADVVPTQQLNDAYLVCGLTRKRVDELEAELAKVKSEIAKEVLLELKKQIHEKAVYTHTQEVLPYISIKAFDAILQNHIKKYTEN
jgi:hypothetical protein